MEFHTNTQVSSEMKEQIEFKMFQLDNIDEHDLTKRCRALIDRIDTLYGRNWSCIAGTWDWDAHIETTRPFFVSFYQDTSPRTYYWLWKFNGYNKTQMTDKFSSNQESLSIGKTTIHPGSQLSHEKIMNIIFTMHLLDSELVPSGRRKKCEFLSSKFSEKYGHHWFCITGKNYVFERKLSSRFANFTHEGENYYLWRDQYDLS